MTNVVAMWCRHQGDNIIGTDNHLPWSIESDTKHFWDVVKDEIIVCGRKTYESLPPLMTSVKKIFVFSTQADFEVCDKEHHVVISSQKQLEDNLSEEEDIYVAGGSEIYQLFMEGKEKFKPHIVVDCVYEGKIENTGKVQKDISAAVALLEKKYRKITPDYCLDNVASSIWVRKGEFVEQDILKKVVHILEPNATLRW